MKNQAEQELEELVLEIEESKDLKSFQDPLKEDETLLSWEKEISGQVKANS